MSLNVEFLKAQYLWMWVRVCVCVCAYVYVCACAQVTEDAHTGLGHLVVGYMVCPKLCVSSSLGMTHVHFCKSFSLLCS